MTDQATIDEVTPEAERFASEVLAPFERHLDLAVDPACDPALERAIETITSTGWDRIAAPEHMGGAAMPPSLVFAVAETMASHAPGLTTWLLNENFMAATLGDEWPAGRTTWALLPGGAGNATTSAGSMSIIPSTGYEGASGPVFPVVPGGATAENVLVLVVGEPIEAHLVTAANLRSSRVSGLRAAGFADLSADPVRLGGETLLPNGPELAERLLALLAIGVCARAAGLLRGAHREALAYTTQRVQGGKAIVEHETIAGVLGQASAMATSLAATAAAAATAVEARHPSALARAIDAQVTANRSTLVTVTELLALFGSYGISREYPMAKLYRDAATLTAPRVVIDGTGFHAPVAL